jgi:hypothetical protein
MGERCVTEAKQATRAEQGQTLRVIYPYACSKVDLPGQLSIINLFNLLPGPSAISDADALVMRRWLCPMSRECRDVQAPQMRISAASSQAGVFLKLKVHNLRRGDP